MDRRLADLLKTISVNAAIPPEESAFIIGAEPRQIENPPDIENSHLKEALKAKTERNGGLLYRNQIYFPKAAIQNPGGLEKELEEAPSMQESLAGLISSESNKTVDARLLMPVEARKYYGYSSYSNIDCHYASLLFHFPSLHLKNPLNEIKDAWNDRLRRLKKGENPKFGDVILIYHVIQRIETGELASYREHSCIYLSPAIVFSKNGGGIHSPFYIQSIYDIAVMYLQSVQYSAERNRLLEIRWEFYRPRERCR